MSLLIKYMVNGGSVLLLCLCISVVDPLFSLYMYLKLQPMSYYYSFSHLYPLSIYKWKHMIRLTDSGFLVNMLYYFYPNMLPLAFNIHFIITFGFWFAVFVVNLKDADIIEHESIVPFFHNMHTVLNHSISFIILFYNNLKNEFVFNDESLYYSFAWVYGWFFFIYIPWRAVTGDVVYSFFDIKKSKIAPIIMFLCCHVLLYTSNQLGKNISGLLKS